MSFCSWLQLGVQGWMSPISYRPSTAMQRRRRCGFLKRLNRYSLLIMDMILIVPCCCWPSMRLVHYIMKLNWFNTVNNEGRGRGQQSVLLASPPCAQYNVFLVATLFVQPLDHSFTPIPAPFQFSINKSARQVHGSIGVGAHGWRARVCQLWGHNSV